MATDPSKRRVRALQRAFLRAGGPGTRLTIVTLIDDVLPDGIARSMARAAQVEPAHVVSAHPLAASVRHELRALRTAAEPAPEARLVAVHAAHVPCRNLMPADAAGSFIGEADAAEAGWRQREPLPARLGKVALIEGAIGQGLADALRRDDAALIAMGAPARNGLHGARAGSFAKRMMRDAPCDLLIARPT